MNVLRHGRLCSAFFLISLCAAVSVGQTAIPDFNRRQAFDVQNYLIRVSFDRSAKKIFGDTTVTLKPVGTRLSQITLDSVGIVYESVTRARDGAKLKYRVARGKVVVDLPRSAAPGEEISVRFRYSAKPSKGVYFIAPQIENGNETRSSQIWTQGQPDEARHWFPSFDFPSDKATTEQFITANADETVIGNGNFLGKISNADGTQTFHYKMPVPHSTYLVSFVVGKYAAAADRFGEVPLGFYIYPGRESIVPQAFGKTKDILRVYQELTGVKFPYNKYDQTIVSGFTFGGMENITATTLADTEVFLVQYDFAKSGVEDLVSHEAAHSWFGNLVTNRNWAELWLNEGFATYMEAAFREKTYGRENYLLKIRNDAAIFMTDDAVGTLRNALFNQNAGDVAKLFDRPAVTYNKGSVVLHMLREEIGDAAFWKGVNIYLNRHRFANVETPDLRKAMEETCGRDLSWFFDQWVYGTGYPKLDVKQNWDEATKTLRLTFVQTQKTEKLTPSAFSLPLEAEFSTAEGTLNQKITLTRRIENVSIKLPSKPISSAFDPHEKLPLKTIKTGSID